MTTKLSDYGILGGWERAVCDGCGKTRSCQVAQDNDGNEYAQCVVCIVKDIDTMEKQREELGV